MSASICVRDATAGWIDAVRQAGELEHRGRPVGVVQRDDDRARLQQRDRHGAEAAGDVGLDERRRSRVDAKTSRSTKSRRWCSASVRARSSSLSSPLSTRISVRLRPASDACSAAFIAPARRGRGR